MKTSNEVKLMVNVPFKNEYNAKLKTGNGANMMVNIPLNGEEKIKCSTKVQINITQDQECTETPFW